MIDSEAITRKIGMVLLAAVAFILLRLGWMVGQMF